MKAMVIMHSWCRCGVSDDDVALEYDDDDDGQDGGGDNGADNGYGDCRRK
jgi:hypothetical protein